tara:strand:+ start:91 stop:489 length:399 start_codon:yes stop_codon:yes gene_type:complete
LKTENLKLLLKDINSIAVVGASSNPSRDSYKVMQFLYAEGYEIFPVNPNETKDKILGLKCYSSLEEINKTIDMVDIFRAKEYVFDITKNAIRLGAKIIWTQEGIIDEKSAKLARKEGIIFVMDKCPKKILIN